MYGRDVAEIHDQLYELRGKDYAAEAKLVAEVVRARVPHAACLLDVGCGTGAHLVHLRESFDRVEGLDYSDAMLAVARRKLPAIPLHLGDMRAFDLGRRFDAVVCLFAAIAHCGSDSELTGALTCLRRHVDDGGVVVVEPRWFSENFADRYVAGEVVETADGRIARLSHTVRAGDMWAMEVQFLIARKETGIRHVRETYRHKLFSRAQYEQAFAGAGLTAEYLEDVQDGRGLFVAQTAKG
jgi:dTDP-3-amino-3,4,6-trideoxy-alpha-D-glucopyranose N,N-dimethyltransferase